MPTIRFIIGKRNMKYRDIIGKMRLVAIMGLMGLMGLMGGCSNEETELPRQSAQVELMSYVSHYTDAETVTRSHPSWAPDGYDLYDDLVGTSGLLSSNTNAAIGAFFTRNGYEPLARKFSYGYDNKCAT